MKPGMTFSAVHDIARRGATDRYLAALLAPAITRPDLLALAAFWAELKQIPDAVREPMAGEIRLQWWRDTLEIGCAPGATALSGHPVADAVAAAVRQHKLPPGLLQGQIDATATLLDAQPFRDLSELRSHLAKTEGAAFTLTARVLGCAHDPQCETAAQHAGEAYGLARLLYDLPAELACGRMMLPATVLAAAGVTPDASPSGLATPLVRQGLAAGLAQLADVARQSHRDMLLALGNVPKFLRPAFLPAALVPLYLALAAAVPDGLHQQMPVPPLRRLWRLLQAHSFGRFS